MLSTWTDPKQTKNISAGSRMLSHLMSNHAWKRGEHTCQYSGKSVCMSLGKAWNWRHETKHEVLVNDSMVSGPALRFFCYFYSAVITRGQLWRYCVDRICPEADRQGENNSSCATVGSRYPEILFYSIHLAKINSELKLSTEPEEITVITLWRLCIVLQRYLQKLVC